MGRDLAEYKRKRDFAASPEPAGDAASGTEHRRFVIQQHDATRLHWDLRLEHEGVLLSWALPKGLPWTPDQDHLAVHTEDHPLEYLDFHGDIPEGNYGAGRMVIWDHGTYEAEKLEGTKAVIVLHGDRARGRYSLFRTRGERDWMIHRMDPPEDPHRRDPPTDLRPMLPVAGPPPQGRGHVWEIRWSGARCLITLRPGDVQVTSADGSDLGEHLPELRRIGRATGSVEAILDAIVVDDGSGALRRRLAAAPSSIRRMANDAPLRTSLLDCIWWEGHSRKEAPWHDRRELLERLALDADAWFTPTAHVGDGAAILAAAEQQGLRLLAKDVASPYLPGERSHFWVEVRQPNR
jgi:bifunctional non-homologous end joining protein LigD